MSYVAILLLAFVVSMVISPFVIRIMKSLKAGQPILSYVDNHKMKKGCPTIGGIIFIIPVVGLTFIFGGRGITIGKYASLVILSYGLIGFLDDYIKIKSSDNRGLAPYQKIIAQLGIALMVAWYAYNNNQIGSHIHLPFSDYILDLGIFYIPQTVDKPL